MSGAGNELRGDADNADSDVVEEDYCQEHEDAENDVLRKYANWWPNKNVGALLGGEVDPSHI